MNRRRLAGLVALAAAAPSVALAAGGSDPKKMAGGASYMPLQPLVGATTRADGRRGVLSVECGLNIPDGSLRERAASAMPRLRAAYGQTVRAYAAGLPPGHPPNADFIARALQQQTDRILGRSGARLLLGAILVN